MGTSCAVAVGSDGCLGGNGGGGPVGKLRAATPLLLDEGGGAVSLGLSSLAGNSGGGSLGGENPDPCCGGS